MLSIELKNANLNIPVISPLNRRFIKRPKLLARNSGSDIFSSSGGNISIQAIKNLSLTLSEGDRLALFGHNGSGKTTLLKVMGGIYPLDSGEMNVSGSVGMIFDISNGFSTELTGRETIRIYQRIFLRNHRVDELEDLVIGFSELGDYVDLPVRIYSSGMKTRLYASLAIQQSHKILLVDEGIGAADAAFQEKFSKKLEEYLFSPGILVLASHSLELTKKFCNKGLVMKSGEGVYMGDIDSAIEFYLNPGK